MEDEPAYDVSVTCVSPPQADRCKARLCEAIKATLTRHRVPAARISVALADDARMARLNELHRKAQGPTDVLSFDLRDMDGHHTDHSASVHVDGEIVVSVETAAREAHQRGHSLDAELALYVVHGTLHLLGYNDHDDPDAARMHEVEDEILTALGIGAIYGGPQP